MNTFTDVVYIELKSGKRRLQFFPGAIVINILSRLPAESVLQCRMVCKRWKRLTSTFEFIELQHKLAKHLVLVVYDRPKLIKRTVEKAMLSTDEETTRLTATPVCKSLRYSINQKISFQIQSEILSSCHGLILYRVVTSTNSSYHDYFICNPVTHEKISLPSKLHIFMDGFYFHPLTNEHRVLHHYCLEGKNYYNYAIYTLETNSGREISCISHDFPSTIDPTIVNGSWFAKEKDDASFRSGRVGNLCANLILRFNINSETIDTLSHPDYQSCSGQHDFNYEMQLVEADEKLCLCHLLREPIVTINAWILEEDSNNKRWVKTYTFCVKWIFRYYSFSFSTSNYNIRILGIYNNVALLFWEGFGLYSHDIRQGILCKVKVEGKFGKSGIIGKSLRIISYKKSLVSLKHSLDVLKGEQVKGKKWGKNSFLFF